MHVIPKRTFTEGQKGHIFCRCGERCGDSAASAPYLVFKKKAFSIQLTQKTNRAHKSQRSSFETSIPCGCPSSFALRYIYLKVLSLVLHQIYCFPQHFIQYKRIQFLPRLFSVLANQNSEWATRAEVLWSTPHTKQGGLNFTTLLSLCSVFKTTQNTLCHASPWSIWSRRVITASDMTSW